MRQRRRRAAEPPHYFTADVPGGFAVGCEQGDRFSYAGPDCYWARCAKTVTPFQARAEARGIVQDLNESVSESLRHTRCTSSSSPR